MRPTRSRSIVTSGATRTNSLLQNSYFGLRSNSMKVTNAPQGWGRCTMNRSRRVFVITSLKRSSLTSRKRWRSKQLNQCVCALGYRKCNPMETRIWCCPYKNNFRVIRREETIKLPSTSRFAARYCKATTPGSLATKSDDPLLALA